MILNMLNKLLYSLIIVLLVYVLFGCNTLNHGFSKIKGEMTFKFDELSANKTNVIKIKRESDLEFGYKDFEIKEGQLILRLFDNSDTILFEQRLDKNSPKENHYKINNLKPGEYLVELLVEDAISGQINVFWKSLKITFEK